MDFAIQVNSLVKVYDEKVKFLAGVDLNVTPSVMIQTTTFVSIFYGLMMVWEREPTF